ncbi:magnesium transporter [Streptomyces sp. M2CJ-2]|uniref:magnesium transporter n=1 Tax=Streptomyces sp. M2CJ-2 TaxID=2803948 RepID=UPI001928DCBA|nr:magnesium transporter [Streptomyces sp. M2CJ-2]MBL3669944.1 magnesium transporter [Streptomyces sp. M2CJ-2]
MRGFMRFSSALRTHPAVLAFPVIGLFFAFVFLTSTRHIERLIAVPWAAQVASYAVHAPVPMAAAAVAGLAAVEATRLRALGTWELGAARSTWRIAVQPILIAVLSLSVLTAGVTAGGLWVVGVLPDLYVLHLMAIVVVLLTAHAVIGFVIGRRFHALYAAPLVAVLVFIGISFPLGTDSYWAHHVTGSIAWLGFGEAYSPAMTAAALLPTVCLAVACVVLAAPRRIRVSSVATSLVIAVSGLLCAYGITKDWHSIAPAAKGLAPITCEGDTPEVCLPSAGSEHIREIQSELAEMTGQLQAKGVIIERPVRITDLTVADVQQLDTRGGHWALDLVPGNADKALRENIAIAVVGIPCAKPDWNALHYNTLWAARTIGVEGEYLAWLSRETQQFSQGQSRGQLLAEMDRVNKLPLQEQKTWYAERLRHACGAGS